jgi:hypothetical protein
MPWTSGSHTAAVVVETCDVQRSPIEQIAICGSIVEVHPVGRHEFVDVFESTVVSEIDDEAVVRRERGPCTFVTETPEGGAFRRHRTGIVGVELDAPVLTK